MLKELEDSYNQKIIKEKENSLAKLKAEKDKCTEILIEKNQLENECSKLKLEIEQIKASKAYDDVSSAKIEQIYKEEEYNELAYVLLKNFEANRFDLEIINEV